MKITRKINDNRRLLMRWLTTRIGNITQSQISLASLQQNKVKVLVIRPNHRLGNQLLMTPLLQEIENTFPLLEIHVFVKGELSKILFANYTTITRHIQLPKKPFSHLLDYIWVWLKLFITKYDLVINIDDSSSSGRIASRVARAKYKLASLEDVFANHPTLFNKEDYKHIAKKPVLLFRYFTKINTNQIVIPSLNIKVSQAEKNAGKIIYNTLNIPQDKKTIVLFTYATGEKILPKTWWKSFYKQLQDSFSQYSIIEVLPVENVSQLDFEVPHFYSKDIREIAGFLSNASLFIGVDSGMMHLAVASGCPTLGLFSCDFISIYKPYGEGNFAIIHQDYSQEKMVELIQDKLIQ